MGRIGRQFPVSAGNVRARRCSAGAARVHAPSGGRGRSPAWPDIAPHTRCSMAGRTWTACAGRPTL